mmetsp:Transcript_17297/g.26692  ORF Transcript_17297/g.26692 Transcript_17297/m.26692 type:complete len:186 (-) Transcript_17297:59-616(-)
MKYAVAVFLGIISTAAAFSDNNAILLEAEQRVATRDSELIQTDGDTGIIDALTPAKGQCEERLWLSQDELDWQMDQFSRHFKVENYNNALKIAKELGVKAPRVHTWELYDKSFSFPRVRRYDFVQNNMDMLEHFQDNLNTNISNSVHVQNFIRVANTIHSNFSQKYHDGEFADPANFDPRDEEEK